MSRVDLLLLLLGDVIAKTEFELDDVSGLLLRLLAILKNSGEFIFWFNVRTHQSLALMW